MQYYFYGRKELNPPNDKYGAFIFILIFFFISCKIGDLWNFLLSFLIIYHIMSNKQFDTCLKILLVGDSG